MRTFLFGALTAPVVLCLVALGYALSGLPSIAADAPSGALERSIMSAAVHASVRREARDVPPAPPVTDSLLIAGGRLYLNNCVGCHGEPGKPPSDFGATFYPRVPQFPAVGTEYTEREIYFVAKHGIRWTGMQSQGRWYREQSLRSLAAFIKHIRELPPAVVESLAAPTKR